jgi:twitching motility protein PilT
MAEIDKYLHQMIKVNASDLHLASGYAPICRIDGELKRTTMPPMPPKILLKILREILDEELITRLTKKRSVYFSYEIPGQGRFRGSAYYHHRGLDVVIRYVPLEIKKLKDLGFPNIIDKMIVNTHGLILLTGPGGCGKSTTLASMVDKINEGRNAHIISLEDSVEFVHENKMSFINQREVGTNTRSYKAALKAALKQDPDVLVIGDMNGPDAISLALAAAENGILVFGCMYTKDAQSTISRLLSIFPNEMRPYLQTRISKCLIGSISQRLIPLKKGPGRAMAFETLVNTPSIGKTIFSGKVHQLNAAMYQNRQEGNSMMDDSVMKLLEKGKISYDAALSSVIEVDEFKKKYHPPTNNSTK